MANANHPPSPPAASETATAHSTRTDPSGCSARDLLACLLLFAATWIVFGRTVQFEFLLWDDTFHITDNPRLLPLSWEKQAGFWREPFFGEYTPLVYAWFGAETWLSQRLAAWHTAAGAVPSPAPDPRVFHAGCVLLHGCVSLAVYALLRRLSAHRLGALAGALLFALHPLQVEAVAWISESRGLLAAALGLLAVHGYLNSADRPGCAAVARPAAHRPLGRRLLWYALASVAYGLALVSKPSAVSIPLLLLVLDGGWWSRSWWRAALRVAPWCGVALALIWLTGREQASQTALLDVPLWRRPLIAADALAFYLYKLVVPARLVTDYGRSPAEIWRAGWVWWTWLIPAAVALLLAWQGGRRVWVAAGLLLAGVAPVLGLVPFGFQNYSTVADRYLYLAMLGPALAVAWLVTQRRTPPVLLAVGLVLTVAAVQSVRQVPVWRNDGTLFLHTLRINPASRPAHNNLSISYRKAGKLQEALTHAEQAIALSPRDAKSRNNRGLALLDLQRYDEAGEELAQAVRLLPTSAIIRANLGLARRKQGRFADAYDAYRRALGVKPDDLTLRLRTGEVAAHMGDRPEAELWLMDVIQRAPRSWHAAQAWGTLAELSQSAGDARQSVFQLRKSLAIRFHHELANNLAWLLATEAEDALRDGPEAVQLAERVCAEVQPSADALDTLAAAYAEAGHLDEAAQTAEQAAVLAEQAGQGDEAAEIRSRRDLYRDGRRYRQPPRPPGEPLPSVLPPPVLSLPDAPPDVPDDADRRSVDPLELLR